MSIPHKCPVCEGRGEIGKRLAQAGAILISAEPQRFRCHGCCATGIVWDTTFNLTPLSPWVTGGTPTIGGGSITHTNGVLAHPYVQSEWQEGIVEINACQTPGDHSRASERDPSWTGGYDCACSPDGEPHSDNCKGAE